MNSLFFTICIGASAGGLPALIEFFEHIPGDSQAAYVVAMHLLRDHRSLLDDILSKHAALPIIRVENDMALEAGKVYLLVENTTMIVQDGYLKINVRDEAVINSSVDRLFESLAIDFREKAIGIILSGGGNDGLEGARKIGELGGMVLVQDPDSAQIAGMPCSIINDDHPVAILKPDEIAQVINKLLKHK
jgi:two-component system chemotaxis response regulator CheB